MSEDKQEKIRLKLTYNSNENLPRTFFVHLYQVPLDAVVSVTQAERELPITRDGDYVESRSWVSPDIDVCIKISRGDTIIASAIYVLHNGKIFAPVFDNKDIDLFQVTYMYG